MLKFQESLQNSVHSAEARPIDVTTSSLVIDYVVHQSPVYSTQQNISKAVTGTWSSTQAVTDVVDTAPYARSRLVVRTARGFTGP